MSEPKFKPGDEVRINPMATSRDFSENGCTDAFMHDLEKKYVIKNIGKYDRTQYTCYLHGTSWNMLEKCLIPYKEENEI